MSSLPPRARRRREAGMALLAVMFLAVMLGALAVGLLRESLAARTAVNHHERSLQALEVAEVGAVQAEMEIRSQVDSGEDGVGTVSGPHGYGEYRVVVRPDAVNPDRSIVDSIGTAGLATRRIEVGLRRRVDARWVEALFARDTLDLHGDVATDAYDSSKGPYSAQAHSTDEKGTYADVGGSIGSNADIFLSGSAAWIRGNAIPGPTREVQISGDPTVTGDMAPRQEEIGIASIPYADFLAAYTTNDNADFVPVPGQGQGRKKGDGEGVTYDAADWTLSLKAGASLTLDGGTYFLKSLTLSSGSTITLTGSARLYVTGLLDLSGGTLVNQGRPQDLQVYAHPYPLPVGYVPTSTTIRLRGGSALIAAIYSPGAHLDVSGGCDLYGAAVIGTVELGGACRFHYDLSLLQLFGGGVATMERLYWREPAPPNR